MRITATTGVALIAALALLGNAPGVRADDDDHEEREDEREHGDEDDERDEDAERDEDDDHGVSDCEDDEDDDDREVRKRRRRRRSRTDHDVRVRLKVRGRKSDELRVRLTVRNRGRMDEQAVRVDLFAEGDPDPVWQQVVDLESGERSRWKFRLPRPIGSDALTAFAGADLDERPENDDETVPIGDGRTASDAELGATLYRSLCVTCHGIDGRGGTSCENVARESWQEIFEALREGEDGMPSYPSLTASDARAIAAYLRDPTVEPPSPPPVPPSPPEPPPPTDTPPTYTADVAPILAASCTSCHRQGNAIAGVRLDSYGAASANPSSWIGSIRAGRMPPAGPLPSAQLQLLEAWQAAGAPE